MKIKFISKKAHISEMMRHAMPPISRRRSDVRHYYLLWLELDLPSSRGSSCHSCQRFRNKMGPVPEREHLVLKRRFDIGRAVRLKDI